MDIILQQKKEKIIEANNHNDKISDRRNINKATKKNGDAITPK